jgi:DNA-binding response OmpR family regulator
MPFNLLPKTPSERRIGREIGGYMNFAIVEDSRGQAEVIKALLMGAGHQVDVFGDGNSCIEALKARSFDFFIIEWKLPDIGGEEVLRQVRQTYGWDVPVVLCAERTDEQAASDILRLGADDYIPKPIRYIEFMARIDALLRRRSPRPATVQLGSIKIDMEGRRVTLSGVNVDLTQREFELAAILLRNVGRLLSRNELLTSVWARDAGIDTRTVDTHASRLRKKLGLAGESGLMLSSVYGQGYRLDTVRHN